MSGLREALASQQADRPSDRDCEFVQFLFEPRKRVQNLGIRLDAMIMEESDPIGDAGSHQIRDKRVRIHDYAFTVTQRYGAHSRTGP